MLHRKWTGIGCYHGGVRYRPPYGANDMSKTDVAQWFRETPLAPLSDEYRRKGFCGWGGIRIVLGWD